uniref:Uncharacterized protein n=1 Tax=Gouania willdenowi TaxID=441366 RepID=A0A8C5HCX0_GOUWI
MNHYSPQVRDSCISKKKKLDRARDKSRINIGVDFQRWRELRDLEGLKTYAELATFLLDSLTLPSV